MAPWGDPTARADGSQRGGNGMPIRLDVQVPDSPESSRDAAAAPATEAEVRPIGPMARLVRSAFFDRYALLVIVLNCAYLALQGPPGAFYLVPEDIAGEIDTAFTVIFTLEMVCKVVGMGVLRPGGYLRESWNQIDFCILLTCWLPLVFPVENMTAFRCVRALRPLRAVSVLPGMRRQVGTILASLPKLTDVAMFSFFVFLIFGIVGMHLFKGSLRYRCFDDLSGEVIDMQMGVCSNMDVADSQGTCEEGQSCRYVGVNPKFDTVNFDNMAWAWMTIFQCVTLEGWTDIMCALRRVIQSRRHHEHVRTNPCYKSFAINPSPQTPRHKSLATSPSTNLSQRGARVECCVPLVLAQVPCSATHGPQPPPEPPPSPTKGARVPPNHNSGGATATQNDPARERTSRDDPRAGI